MKVIMVYVIAILTAAATYGFTQNLSSATHNATSSSLTSDEQSHQAKKRYTNKEMTERMREESHTNAATFRAKIDDNLKVASDKKADIQRRRNALVDLGRSQDLRAAKELLKFVESTETLVADGALGSLSNMSNSFKLNEDFAQLTEFKKIVEPKVLSIAKEEPMNMRRSASVTAILSDFGDDVEAVKLAKKLLNKGQYGIINLFYYRDYSTTPATFRIKTAAKQLFLESISEKQPEEIRVKAAALLSKAGDTDAAFPVLSSILLQGKDLIQRQIAMDELYAVGDERSREAVSKAADIPTLSASAKDKIMCWGQRHKK